MAQPEISTSQTDTAYAYVPSSFHSFVTREFGGAPQLLFETTHGESQYVAETDPLMFYLMQRLDQYTDSQTLQLPLKIPGTVEPDKSAQLTFSDSLSDHQIRLLISDLLISDVHTRAEDRVFPVTIDKFVPENPSRSIAERLRLRTVKSPEELLVDHVGAFCTDATADQLRVFVKNMWWDSMGLYSRKGRSRTGEAIGFAVQPDGRIDIAFPDVSITREKTGNTIENIELEASGHYRIAKSSFWGGSTFVLAASLMSLPSNLRAVWYDLAAHGTPYSVHQVGSRGIEVNQTHSNYDPLFFVYIDSYKDLTLRIGPNVSSVLVQNFDQKVDIYADKPEIVEIRGSDTESVKVVSSRVQT